MTIYRTRDLLNVVHSKVCQTAAIPLLRFWLPSEPWWTGTWQTVQRKSGRSIEIYNSFVVPQILKQLLITMTMIPTLFTKRWTVRERKTERVYTNNVGMDGWLKGGIITYRLTVRVLGWPVSGCKWTKYLWSVPCRRRKEDMEEMKCFVEYDSLPSHLFYPGAAVDSSGMGSSSAHQEDQRDATRGWCWWECKKYYGLVLLGQGREEKRAHRWSVICVATIKYKKTWLNRGLLLIASRGGEHYILLWRRRMVANRVFVGAWFYCCVAIRIPPSL